jgi:hypothetical protein
VVPDPCCMHPSRAVEEVKSKEEKIRHSHTAFRCQTRSRIPKVGAGATRQQHQRSGKVRGHHRPRSVWVGAQGRRGDAKLSRCTDIPDYRRSAESQKGLAPNTSPMSPQPFAGYTSSERTRSSLHTAEEWTRASVFWTSSVVSRAVFDVHHRHTCTGYEYSA